MYTEQIKEKRKLKKEQEDKDRLVNTLIEFSSKIDQLSDSLTTAGVQKLDREVLEAINKFSETVDKLDGVKVTGDEDIKEALQTLGFVISRYNPVVNIPETVVNIEKEEIDLSPLVKAFDKLSKNILSNKVVVPKTDMSKVEKELTKIKEAISNITFPIPNYLLPFLDSNGSHVALQLDSGGGLPISITGVATEANQTNGSQKSQIVDSGGEAVTVTGGKLDVNATVSGGVGSSAVDDSAFTAAVDSGTPMMGFATSDAVNSGDVGVVAMDVNRNLKVIGQSNSGVDIGDVTINNGTGASAVNIQDGGNAITVDYATTGSGTSTGALRVELPTNGTGVVGLNAGTNNIGDVDVLTVPADPFGLNADSASATGSISAKLRGIATALGVTALDLGSGTGGTRTLRVFRDTAQFVGGSGTDTSATQRVSLATNVALPTGSNVIGALTANQSVNLAQVNAVTTLTGTGATGTGAQRVTVAVDSATVAGSASLPAGTNAIGKLSANSGVDIGDVDITSAVSATLDHGSNQDIDTSAEQITSTSFACKFGVTLRAPDTNTATLWIGNSDVTVGGTAATDGIPLYPGDSLFLPVTNSNIPYAIASANNQVIYWIAV